MLLSRGVSSAWPATAGLAIGVVAGGCGAVTAREATAGGHAGQQARAYAQRLLTRLELPAGARSTAWPSPPVRLLKRMLPDWLHDVVNAQALYRVGAPGALGQFLTGHVPAGMMPAESGQGGLYVSRGSIYFCL